MALVAFYGCRTTGTRTKQRCLRRATPTHQFFFILSGKATLEIDGSRQMLSQHEGVEVPPNVPHQMLNQSNCNLEFLVISQPPSHGDRFLSDIIESSPS
ncbi:cupin domain-containing protein [Nostoc sp. XA010]|uniref:cupin domain-containing protein n=1 Tax=Nostoc sp. XA010 TaxID=2780407 RepID=UPI001E41FD2C|nr:cupin domain-containing protein [Nostoc sp. XA010]MCC5661034.1 cupin domain-containing protein [Nostoc sp. XA010]